MEQKTKIKESKFLLFLLIVNEILVSRVENILMEEEEKKKVIIIEKTRYTPKFVSEKGKTNMENTNDFISCIYDTFINL